MNVSYSLIYFLPGAGGNFLARALNLLDNAYCFCDLGGNFPQNLDEKLELLSYDTVIGKSYGQRNWKEFEAKIKHYSIFHSPRDLESGSLAIWYSHPDLSLLDKNLAGPQDHMQLIYLDTQDHQYWAFVNALFKNSYIVGDWFRDTVLIEKLSNLYRFNLSTLIGTNCMFMQEYEKLAHHLDRSPDRCTLDAVDFLWNQWRSTVLEIDEIDRFKQIIGLHF